MRSCLSADIVITSGRARAVQRLGLDPDRFLAAGTDRVWVAITAHGWDDDRVGFGDDVAATAGLVAWHPDGRPRFAADAIADPLGGAWAAAAARDAWAAGGRWFLDASLAGIAAAAVTAATTEPAQPAQPAGAGWRVGGTQVGSPLSPPGGRHRPPAGRRHRRRPRGPADDIAAAASGGGSRRVRSPTCSSWTGASPLVRLLPGPRWSTWADGR